MAVASGRAAALLVGAAVLVVAPALPFGAAARPAYGAGVPLVWHAERAGGEALASSRADEPVNPASVVKLMTTLWALERLGPAHRFETRFGTHGALDRATGVLDGDLLVHGSGDPDFHVENAMLVAAALRRAGVREVRGALVVDDTFWIGWESGVGGRLADPAARARLMASRLRAALDPARWDAATRAAWRRSAARRAWPGAAPPGIVVRGGATRAPHRAGATILARHRSNPLARTLKRFNVYSNNDIERLGATLGPPARLATVLAERWQLPPAAVRLESLSGLGTNRLPARAMVRLVADLERACAAHEIDLADLLAVSGCDVGTLRLYPDVGTAPAGAVAAKSGTLGVTDGGVSVLAGRVSTGTGPIRFAVAAPRAGHQLPAARRAIARWLLALARDHGGLAATACGSRAGYPDDDASASSAE